MIFSKLIVLAGLLVSSTIASPVAAPNKDREDFLTVRSQVQSSSSLLMCLRCGMSRQTSTGAEVSPPVMPTVQKPLRAAQPSALTQTPRWRRTTQLIPTTARALLRAASRLLPTPTACSPPPLLSRPLPVCPKYIS
jgi:hypothetical protein